jgi:hypothetical protein
VEKVHTVEEVASVFHWQIGNLCEEHLIFNFILFFLFFSLISMRLFATYPEVVCCFRWNHWPKNMMRGTRQQQM